MLHDKDKDSVGRLGYFFQVARSPSFKSGEAFRLIKISSFPNAHVHQNDSLKYCKG
jgi:hypothetical protein